MDYIGDRVRETGYYDAANEKIFLLGAADKARTVKTGLASSSGLAADTRSIALTVQYIDNDRSESETSSWTYNDADNSITRNNVYFSTRGTASILFDELLTGNLVIYSTTPSDVFGIRCVDEDVFSYSGGAIVDGSATTSERAANTRIITPKNEDTTLIVNWAINGIVARDGVSGTNMQSYTQMGHVNDSSVDTNLGFDKRLGLGLLASDPDMIIEGSSVGFVKLDQTKLNGSGEWELVPMYRVGAAGQEFTLVSVDIHYREIF